MNEPLEHIDDLIAKVAAGEASTEEISSVNNWKQLSADNTAYFEDALKLFKTIDAFKTKSNVDANTAWEKLENRINTVKNKNIVPISRASFILRAVAAIAFLTSLGFVIQRLLTTTPSQPPVIFATSGATLEQKLPDGSTVFMNKNTEIHFVIDENNVRQVSLKGEAFFEVLHNEKQPFVVTLDELSIKDIGTAFNVKAVDKSEVVEVFVKEGEVELFLDNKKNMRAVMGEKAFYNKHTHQFSKVKSNPSVENTTSYMTKAFHFSKTNLSEVIEELNTVYETDIRLSNKKLGRCQLSVTFNNEDLDIVLEIVAETLDLEIIRSGKIILLKGESCYE